MNAPAQKHPLVVFKEQLDQRVDQFRYALPAHMPPERFARVVLTAAQNNPDLLTAERQSVWNACMRAAQDGLLPDGREGAIVLYGKQAQWMPMVAGIQKKARNSGDLSGITARVVYFEDQFRYWIDEAGEHLLYEPADNPDTSKVRLVFAMARTKDGELFVEPMSVADVEKVRGVSKAKNNGPWVTWWGEMAKKTAIRRLSKRLPMSSDLDDLVRRDDDLYDFAQEPRGAKVIDFDAGQEPTATERKGAPPPAAKTESKSPSGGGSAGADAPKADGATGGEGQAPPAEATALEGSIAKALDAATSKADVQGVASLFGGEVAEATADAQERIDAMFAAAHQRVVAGPGDFPGDWPASTK